jgi:hypothetical protein
MGKGLKQTNGQEVYEKESNITDYQRNANQNHMRYYLTSVRMAILKKTKDNKCWQGCAKIGTLCTLGENIKGYNHYGKHIKGSQKKLQIELPYDPAISILGNYLKELKTES